MGLMGRALLQFSFLLPPGEPSRYSKFFYVMPLYTFKWAFISGGSLSWFQSQSVSLSAAYRELMLPEMYMLNCPTPFSDNLTGSQSQGNGFVESESRILTFLRVAAQTLCACM